MRGWIHKTEGVDGSMGGMVQKVWRAEVERIRKCW